MAACSKKPNERCPDLALGGWGARRSRGLRSTSGLRVHRYGRYLATGALRGARQSEDNPTRAFGRYVTAVMVSAVCRRCLRIQAPVSDVVFSFYRCVPSPIWIRLIEHTDSISWRSPATPTCFPGREPSAPWSRIPRQSAEISLRHSQNFLPVIFDIVCAMKCGTYDGKF